MPIEADPVVTGEELAEKLGISDRLVRQLAERTIIKRESPNRYRLWRSISGYVSHLREQAAGRASSDDDDNPDLARERALLARAQREGQAMKNAIMRGELLPVDDVEAVVGAVLDATRAKLLALPTKAAPQCVGLPGLVEARDLLTGMVHDALSDLSATPVVVADAADRARRRIGRGTIGDAPDAEAEATAAPDRKRMG